MEAPGGPAVDSAERDGEWYRRLVASATDVIVVVDSDGAMTYVSPAVERVLGYDPDDLRGELATDYAHPKDRGALREEMAGLLRDPAEPRTVDGRVRRADGSWCWMEATLRNRLHDDVIGGIVVTARENTERLATKERMELALEGAKLGIWDWDMETDEVSRDELLTEMLGYTPAEMGTRMRDWEELVHPAGKERHDEALAAHVEDRTPYFQCDYRMETKAGDWKWVRTTGRVVERDDAGTPVRAVGIHQDIDDRKADRERLETQRDNLEVLNEVLRHDIRNDIQLITSYAEMLAENCPAETRDHAETILENAQHAVELTRTAREMADVMLSAEEDLEPVSLRGALERPLEEVRSAYPDAEVVTDGSIPPVRVCGNDMLDSVFRNVLKNAVQHNDAAVPAVAVSATEREDEVTVRVADNGPGVLDAQKETIFGKGETGLDSHGTGLGLYLVRSLVESYGGTVRVEDRENRHRLPSDPGSPAGDDEPTGAVFVVELPTVG